MLSSAKQEAEKVLSLPSRSRTSVSEARIEAERTLTTAERRSSVINEGASERLTQLTRQHSQALGRLGEISETLVALLQADERPVRWSRWWPKRPNARKSRPSLARRRVRRHLAAQQPQDQAPAQPQHQPQPTPQQRSQPPAQSQAQHQPQPAPEMEPPRGIQVPPSIGDPQD